jgi:transcriptional regulator with XRE-family HTH domain
VPTPLSTVAQLAASLRSAAQEKQLTQTEIAAGSSVDQSQVSRILAGKFVNRSQNVMRICAYLQVPVSGDSQRPKVTEQMAESLSRLWDGSPEHECRLIELLAAIERATGPK